MAATTSQRPMMEPPWLLKPVRRGQTHVPSPPGRSPPDVVETSSRRPRMEPPRLPKPVRKGPDPLPLPIIAALEPPRRGGNISLMSHDGAAMATACAKGPDPLPISATSELPPMWPDVLRPVMEPPWLPEPVRRGKAHITVSASLEPPPVMHTHLMEPPRPPDGARFARRPPAGTSSSGPTMVSIQPRPSDTAVLRSSGHAHRAVPWACSASSGATPPGP